MEFKKGTALIVGKTINEFDDYITTDGVVIYDAYALSIGQPQLLDNAILSNDDIYICGHGSRKNNEFLIDGKTMKEIAKALKDNCNYEGIQTIHIMSCHSKHKNMDNDAAKILKEELEKLLNKPVEVVSEAFNIAIVVEKDKNTALFYDIEPEPKLLFRILQPIFLKKHRLHSLKIEKSEYSVTLQSYYDSCKSLIGKYNHSIGRKEAYSIIDIFKRFIAIDIGVILSMMLSVTLLQNKISTGRLSLSVLLVTVILTEIKIGKSTKKNIILWRVHLATVSLLTLNICLIISREVFKYFSYNINSFKYLLILLGILFFIILGIGALISGKYDYGYWED